MSLRIILLIIIVIALLDGFSGLGGGPFLRDRLLRRRRPWLRARNRVYLGLARKL